MLVKQHEYECLCLPGYYGEHCEKRPCDNVDCHSRGTCVNLLTSSTCKATAISGWNCDPGTDYRCNCDEGLRLIWFWVRLRHCNRTQIWFSCICGIWYVYILGFYGLDCIFEIGEEIDVLTTTSTTSTIPFTLFPPTTTTTTTTTTTVSTTPEPKVVHALAWAGKNIAKVFIAIVAGFVVLSCLAHVLWMLGPGLKAKRTLRTDIFSSKCSPNLNPS